MMIYNALLGVLGSHSHLLYEREMFTIVLKFSLKCFTEESKAYKVVTKVSK